MRTSTSVQAPLRRGLTFREPHDVLIWRELRRDALLRSPVARAGSEPLAQLIAIANTDALVRLRLPRAIRDAEHGR